MASLQFSNYRWEGCAQTDGRLNRSNKVWWCSHVERFTRCFICFSLREVRVFFLVKKNCEFLRVFFSESRLMPMKIRRALICSPRSKLDGGKSDEVWWRFLLPRTWTLKHTGSLYGCWPKNRGFCPPNHPKSSILIGFGTIIFGNIRILKIAAWKEVLSLLGPGIAVDA